ncbi:MAG: cell division protein FtsL [Thiotrichales bacterium]|jgi:cell division protein FtsL|nr:cell division protein FtsL [Pseudomonadota bacterium]MCI4411127.1 cell division protein FtsL [Thiotrichales bacterium]
MKNAPLPSLLSLWSWGVFVWITLIVFLLVSAIAVVWTKHQVRLTSTELHKTVKKDYALRVEEGRLALEYNHLLSRTRIEQIAREKLSMVPMTTAQERVLLLPEGVQPP